MSKLFEPLPKPVHIIIPGVAIGGTEKRLAALWLYLVERGQPLILCVSPELHGRLLEIPAFAGMKRFTDKVILIPWRQSFLGQLRLYRAHCQAHSGAIHHFAMYHPTRKPNRVRTMYTFPATSLQFYSRFQQMGIRLFMRLADTVDILDPLLYQRARTWPWLRGRRVRMTATSFVEIDHIPPVSYELKRGNVITFLGRFISDKRVEEFVRAIPGMYTALADQGVHEVSFNVIGHGPLEEKLKSIIAGFPPEIEVRLGYDPNPAVLLSTSKLFYSLQEFNNYPSKAALEAMAAGNSLVVTRCGTTEMMAREDFSFYIDPYFSEKDLVAGAVWFFTKTKQQQAQMAAAAREVVETDFTIEKMASYFVEEYRLLMK